MTDEIENVNNLPEETPEPIVGEAVGSTTQYVPEEDDTPVVHEVSSTTSVAIGGPDLLVDMIADVRELLRILTNAADLTLSPEVQKLIKTITEANDCIRIPDDAQSKWK